MTEVRIFEIETVVEGNGVGSGPTAVAATHESTAWKRPPADLKDWTRSAPWRAAAEQRRSHLANELARLDLTGSQVAEREALEMLLADADAAIQERVWLAAWWWGSEVERVWARLHEVEERLVELLPVEELEARATEVSTWAGTVLKSDDKRLQALDMLRVDVAAGKKPAKGLRAPVISVLRAQHAQTDRDNLAARFLRNRMLLASTGSLVASGALLLTQHGISHTHFLTSPGAFAEQPTTFLFLLMLFGAVGALITAIAPFTAVPSDFSPFNLPLQQGLLKVALGPVVAVVGMMIMSAADTTGAVSSSVLAIGVPSSIAGVLVLAVVFGAAQHIVTRYVDRRAADVIDALAPEKKE